MCLYFPDHNSDVITGISWETPKMAAKTKTGCRPWRKILYEDQNVPDNYVDESFLLELKKNCK